MANLNLNFFYKRDSLLKIGKTKFYLIILTRIKIAVLHAYLHIHNDYDSRQQHIE